jgi:hypothetical protein
MPKGDAAFLRNGFRWHNLDIPACAPIFTVSGSAANPVSRGSK